MKNRGSFEVQVGPGTQSGGAPFGQEPYISLKESVSNNNGRSRVPKIIAHSPAKDEVSTDMSPLRG